MLYVGNMKWLWTILGLASPLIAIELVKAIVFALTKLQEHVMSAFPWNATIVQAAIDLTQSNATAVAILLAVYAVYVWQLRRREKITDALYSAARAAAIVMPASLYLVGR